MNTFFIIEKVGTASMTAMVVANGIHNPLEQREVLEGQLKSQGIRGTVVFDLLLALGTKGRRYFVADFDGEKLAPLSRASDVPQIYTEQSARTLKKHVAELDFSLLGKAMAFAVKQGYSF